MRWEYLIFDLVVASSYLFARMYRQTIWPKLVPGVLAIGLVSSVFLIWDHFVTGWWWSFNSVYISGLFLGKLPIEEVLFFVVVPAAVLLLWENIRVLWPDKNDNKYQIIYLLLGMGALYLCLTNWYGLIVGVLTIFVFGFLGDSRLKKTWTILVLTVLGLTSIFNLYLTWRPVVVYNQDEISGIKLVTIPLEDFYYGLVLILFTVLLYEKFRKYFKTTDGK